MPFPHVNSEFETLFEPTRVWLFGKPFKSIAYVPEEMWGLTENDEGRDTTEQPSPGQRVPSQTTQTPRATEKWTKAFQRDAKLVPSDKPHEATDPDPQDPAVAAAPQQHPPFRANEFVNYKAGGTGPDPNAPDNLSMPPRRIERKLRQKDQQFARIYSFSFEGHYYRLPRPLLFLLSGSGRRPDEDAKARDPFDRHVAFATKFSGMAGEDWQFSDDIRVWAVDRKDLAVCLDVEIANYQELLLQSMIARGGNASRGDMVSRGDVVGRGDGGNASRGAGAGAFRGDMIGPHQNW